MKNQRSQGTQSAIVASMLLVVCLIFGACGQKRVTTNPGTSAPVVAPAAKADQVIRDAKRYGPVVAQALDEGIKQEALLASTKDGNGRPIIDPAIEPQLRQWLGDARITVGAFNARVATWEHFDPQKQADVDKFIEDALAFIEKINNEGVLHIKNPKSQLIAAGILSGARLTLALWKSSREAQ